MRVMARLNYDLPDSKHQKSDQAEDRYTTHLYRDDQVLVYLHEWILPVSNHFLTTLFLASEPRYEAHSKYFKHPITDMTPRFGSYDFFLSEVGT